MIDFQRLIACEVNYPRDFADVEERPYGLLYYNLENPQSHDSNHAVILDLKADLPVVIEDIVAFYRGKGLVPRLYTAFQPGDLERLRPYLEARGFQFFEDPQRLFVLEGSSRLRPHPQVAVCRVRALGEGIVALINSEQEEPWSVGVLKRQLVRDDYHLLVGFVGDRAVSKASINVLDGLSEVEDVVTHVAHRGKGYARAVIGHLVSTYAGVSRYPLYLWSYNPTAIRIYEEAGFVEQKGTLRDWSAYLP